MKLNCFRGIRLFITVITFVIACSSLSYTQNLIDTIWTKNFPGIYSDVARQVKATNDGGFIVTGESESFGPGIWAAYVIKTDSSGNIEWNKTYGGAAFDFSYGIEQTDDGGFIVATYTTSFGPTGTNLRLIKLDESGDTLWTSLFPNSNQHTVNTAGCILQTSDGGYLLSASGWRPPNANQISLFKTDSLGIVEWNKNYGGSTDDYGATIQKTNDGNYILAGYTYSYGSGQCDGYLVKINEAGDTLWTKFYGGSSYDSFRFVRTVSDGGFIAVGTTQSFANSEQAWVVKVDSQGIEEWSHAIGGAENEAFEGVVETINKDYFLSGSTNSIGSGQHDAFFVRLDNEGNTIQQRAIGTQGEDFGSTIENTNDSAFIAVGSKEGAYLDMWLIKFIADSVVSGNDDPFYGINPADYKLYDNYPNPFNPETSIKFSIPAESFVELAVYNSLGEKISILLNETLKAGTYSRNFKAKGLTSGVYFYRLSGEGFSLCRKMILMK